MEERPTDEQTVHLEVITLLKRSVYNYPNATHPTLLTITNHPLTTKAILDPNNTELYPDIVIINTALNKVVMIGEVETTSSINENETEQWRQFANLQTIFYIFYPKGFYNKIRD
ncbi:MAG: hypothetical protein N2748_00445, partial [candidate division WOR-3 bacterium]|nr:hypothetical protein [candidate division WOR-3 bacterium]